MTLDTDLGAVSVIIPVYKSASTLLELHTRLCDVVKEIGMGEIIYVNDASPDQSMEILLQLPRTVPYKIISLRSNSGQSTALLCGIKKAAFPVIATLDADLQDYPEFIPSLIGKLSPETDVVFASRSGTYESFLRHVSSIVFKTIVYLFSAGRIPLQSGLFLVIRKQSCKNFFQFLPHNPYLIGLIARFRLHCVAVPVWREKNLRGDTSYTLRKRLRVAGDFFRTLGMSGAGRSIDPEKWWLDTVIEHQLGPPK